MLKPFSFSFFYQKQDKKNDNSGYGNEIGILKTSETKVRNEKCIGNCRNLNMIDKHNNIKISQYNDIKI